MKNKKFIDLLNILKLNDGEEGSLLKTSPQFLKNQQVEIASEEYMLNRCLSFANFVLEHKKYQIIIQSLLDHAKVLTEENKSIKYAVLSNRTLAITDKKDGIEYIVCTSMPDNVIFYLEENIGDLLLTDLSVDNRTETEEYIQYAMSKKAKFTVTGNIYANDFKESLINPV